MFLIDKFSNSVSVAGVIEEETVYHTSLRSLAFSVPIQLGAGAPFGRSTLVRLQVYESEKRIFPFFFLNRSIQDFSDRDASKEPTFP